jgi:1,4-dihydroxy-6-naphthoate synthase
MEEEVMYKHIQLYVNDYSVDLGTKGKDAIIELFKRSSELNLIPKMDYDIFTIK